ncbi:hypothetical protein MMC11_004758 [Xylographa trunciseda]|nr:hypothetical protein [Xylographa trunciseda]
MGTVTVDSAPGTIEATEEEWDEERITSSLALLQELHIQLRDLRETIPSLMQVMHVEHASPQAFYTDMSQTAMKSITSIQSFSSLIKDSKSQGILIKANESRTKNDQGITGWLVTQHPDWLDRAVQDGVKELRLEEENDVNNESPGTISWEDATPVLDKFREKHPSIEVLMDHEFKSVKFYLPPPARIHFQIQLQPGPQGNGIYTVTCTESSRLHAGILRSIAKRPRADDLQNLLVTSKLSLSTFSADLSQEMLASYSDIKTTACHKCGKLLDFDAQFPILRSAKRTKGSSDTFSVAWEALHTGCS